VLHYNFYAAPVVPADPSASPNLLYCMCIFVHLSSMSYKLLQHLPILTFNTRRHWRRSCRYSSGYCGSLWLRLHNTAFWYIVTFNETVVCLQYWVHIEQKSSELEMLELHCGVALSQITLNDAPCGSRSAAILQ
jgi:hypothetical protein